MAGCSACGGGSAPSNGAYTAPTGVTVWYVLNNLIEMQCVLLDDDGFCYPFNSAAEAQQAALDAGLSGVASAFTI